jgi:hypothetical protein
VIAAHTILTPDSATRVARAFRTLGLIGFWIQFVFVIAVALLGIWAFGVNCPIVHL